MNIIQFFFLLFMHLAHIFSGFFCPSFFNSTIYCAILFFVTLYLVFSLYFCISPLFRSKTGWEIVVGTSGGISHLFQKSSTFSPPLHNTRTTGYTNIHYSLFLCIKKEGHNKYLSLLFFSISYPVTHLLPCSRSISLQLVTFVYNVDGCRHYTYRSQKL